MIKNLIKKMFIILGIIGMGIIFLLSLIEAVESDDLSMIFLSIIFFDTPVIILFVFSAILLVVGVIIKGESKKNEIKGKTSKSIIKWKILLIIGTIPFVIVIYFAIFGIGVFMGTANGIDAILLLSLILWPLYIVGAVLVIVSSIKIRRIKQNTRAD